MSDHKTKEAVAESRASLATARISLDELARLRAAARGPLPGLTVLVSLLGRPYDSDDVAAVTGTLVLRRRKRPTGGQDVLGRQAGIRMRLDDAEVIEEITLLGDGEDGFSAWHGPLEGGLNMTSPATEVRQKMGPPARRVEQGGVVEERHALGAATAVFVLADGAIRQVHLRRGSP